MYGHCRVRFLLKPISVGAGRVYDLHSVTHGGLEHIGLVKGYPLEQCILGLRRNRFGESKIIPSIKQPTITPRRNVGIEMTPHDVVYTNGWQELGMYVWSTGGDRIQVDSLEKCRKGINGVKDKRRAQGAFAIPSRGVGDVGGPQGVLARVNLISAMKSGANVERICRQFLVCSRRHPNCKMALLQGEEGVQTMLRQFKLIGPS